MKVVGYEYEYCIASIYVRFLKVYIKENRFDDNEKDIIIIFLKIIGITLEEVYV